MQPRLNSFLFAGLIASQTCGVFAAVPVDDELLNQYITDDTYVIACNAIDVGPNLWVDPGVYLELSAPVIRFHPEVSIAGILSAGDIQCYDADSLILELTDPAGFDICVPERSSTVSGTTVTVCSDTTCGDGSTGCMIHVTVSDAGFNADSSTIQASLDFDDTQIGVELSSLLFNDQCQLSAQNVQVDVDGSMELVPECDSRFYEIAAVDAEITIADTSILEFTDCGSAATLNLLLLPSLLDYAGGIGQDAIEQTLPGQFMCLPP
ncbi:MAG: hypothetical protein LJE70_16760 [Chromatiaceae bacterium]|nr:hypothetical protein [Chromatiaceae bacterium]